ncbi:WhiB family transcriptional regulator [Streptomyces sp. AHA2]|uniref:WhiB family transcriptional regulator n=1 Tax=Streptomyces sp. AHA2 TaxID=3064526 RepID=UPI003FA7D0DD
MRPGHPRVHGVVAERRLRGRGPRVVLPVGTAGPALRDVTAAKRVCARCPVTEACLSYALSNGRASGVWGGTCEEERDALLGKTTNDVRRRSAL